MSPAARPAVWRFLEKVNQMGPVPECAPELGRCWEWTASLGPKGYGQFHWTVGSKRMWLAHRAAWKLFVDGEELDPALTLDHLCRNIRCVNPAHLEQVTQAVNSLRGMSPPAKNKRKTHCPVGHPLEGSNLIVEGPGKRKCRACKNARQNAPAVRERKNARRRANYAQAKANA